MSRRCGPGRFNRCAVARSSRVRLRSPFPQRVAPAARRPVGPQRAVALLRGGSAGRSESAGLLRDFQPSCQFSGLARRSGEGPAEHRHPRRLARTIGCGPECAGARARTLLARGRPAARNAWPRSLVFGRWRLMRWMKRRDNSILSSASSRCWTTRVTSFCRCMSSASCHGRHREPSALA